MRLMRATSFGTSSKSSFTVVVIFWACAGKTLGVKDLNYIFERAGIFVAVEKKSERKKKEKRG